MREAAGAGPDETDGFEQWRGMLFGVAYRMLGTASEAEDVVQEAYLRWRGTDRAAVVSPGAWLTKVVTNLCLNQLGSARVRRERYVGQWLPEPVLTGPGTLDAPGAPGVLGAADPFGTHGSGAPTDPTEAAELREEVSFALLVLLERLTPPERAVFVLREAFGYAHREIADVLGVSEPYSRQLYVRARRTVGDSSRPAERPASAQSLQSTRSTAGTALGDLLARFLAAAREGDLAGLERLLTDDVVSYADGGGKVNTARHPIAGRAKVARYLAGGMLRFAADTELTPTEVNGEPALLAFAGEQLVGVLSIEVADGRVDTLHIVANPHKMEYMRRQLAALSHPRRPTGQ